MYENENENENKNIMFLEQKVGVTLFECFNYIFAGACNFIFDLRVASTRELLQGTEQFRFSWNLVGFRQLFSCFPQFIAYRWADVVLIQRLSAARKQIYQSWAWTTTTSLGFDTVWDIGTKKISKTQRKRTMCYVLYQYVINISCTFVFLNFYLLEHKFLIFS